MSKLRPREASAQTRSCPTYTYVSHKEDARTKGIEVRPGLEIGGGAWWYGVWERSDDPATMGALKIGDAGLVPAPALLPHPHTHSHKS